MFEARDAARPAGRARSSGSTSRIRSSTAFFAIKSLDVPYPGRLGEMGLMGEFYGIHEDNDPIQPADGRHQLQHGHRRLHGVVGDGLYAVARRTKPTSSASTT